MATAGEAPQQDAGPLAEPLPPGSGLRWCRVFPGEGSQLSVLRRWLASLLPDCPARDDATLVATELATNAIVHTASGRGGWFAGQITWCPAVVQVAVADCGAPGGPRWAVGPAAEHGRGLLVVRTLAARTGVSGDHRGRLVWADIPWADAAAPASPPPSYDAALARELLSRTAELPSSKGGLLAVLTEYRHALAALTADPRRHSQPACAPSPEAPGPGGRHRRCLGQDPCSEPTPGRAS